MLPWRHGLAHREGDLMDLDLRDKVFLVTGAAAGLGLPPPASCWPGAPGS